MPFDGTDFPERRPKRRRPTRQDNLISVLIVVLALCLLLTPISVGAMVDIVEALRAR
jgi:hypothetical protein